MGTALLALCFCALSLVLEKIPEAEGNKNKKSQLNS